MKTIVELLTATFNELDRKFQISYSGAARREFALAKTAIEEAMMRYTRGRAFEEGVQKNHDFDKEETS